MTYDKGIMTYDDVSMTYDDVVMKLNVSTAYTHSLHDVTTHDVTTLAAGRTKGSSQSIQ